MIRRRISSKPTVPTVTLESFKNMSRYPEDVDDEDPTFINFLLSAEEWLAEQTGYCLEESANYRFLLPGFPLCGIIWLRWQPLLAVTAVKYYDSNGDLQTVDPTHYTVEPENLPPSIYFKSSFEWPDLDTERLNPVIIEATFGGGMSSGHQELINLMVGYKHRNRDMTGILPPKSEINFYNAVRELSWEGYP